MTPLTRPATNLGDDHEEERWLALLGDLPDDAEIDAEKLMYWLWVKQKIEKSEASAAAGDVYMQEEIEHEMTEWPATKQV